jgi:hypothetical protein
MWRELRRWLRFKNSGMSIVALHRPRAAGECAYVLMWRTTKYSYIIPTLFLVLSIASVDLFYKDQKVYCVGDGTRIYMPPMHYGVPVYTFWIEYRTYFLE